MGTEKSLILNGWGFQILLFKAQKSSGDFKNFSIFPGGDEGSVKFSNGDGISGYFSHRGAPGTNFGPFFPVGRGSHRVCDTGVSWCWVTLARIFENEACNDSIDIEKSINKTKNRNGKSPLHQHNTLTVSVEPNDWTQELDVRLGWWSASTAFHSTNTKRGRRSLVHLAPLKGCL